jgi:hypothetical protein
MSLARENTSTVTTRNLIAMMAADLIRMGILTCERDAVQALSLCGYRAGDVAVLAEAALQEALKAVVNRRAG